MATARYISPDGNQYEITVPIGQNLKQAALDNMVPGIIGDCGGTATCGTCHAYIDHSFLGLLSRPSADEELTLEGVPAELRSNSRLTCQISMCDELNGIVLELPDTQL